MATLTTLADFQRSLDASIPDLIASSRATRRGEPAVVRATTFLDPLSDGLRVGVLYEIASRHEIEDSIFAQGLVAKRIQSIFKVDPAPERTIKRDRRQLMWRAEQSRATKQKRLVRKSASLRIR
jgi:hypothetical protein